MPNYCIEDELVVEYTGEWRSMVEVDPVTLSLISFSDWDGYIYIKEISGNSVDYELRSVVGGIEYVESSGTISGNGVVKIILSDTVNHRLYIKSNDGTSTGQVKIAYRINYYK